MRFAMSGSTRSAITSCNAALFNDDQRRLQQMVIAVAGAAAMSS
jgi:hypothetical protein